jgi:hypothetical protein
MILSAMTSTLLGQASSGQTNEPAALADPVKDRLETAKETYRTKLTSINKDVVDALDTPINLPDMQSSIADGRLHLVFHNHRKTPSGEAVVTKIANGQGRGVLDYTLGVFRFELVIEIAASILSAMRRLGPKNGLHDITPYGVMSLVVEATSVSFKREGGFSDE